MQRIEAAEAGAVLSVEDEERGAAVHLRVSVVERSIGSCRKSGK
jgi:hypothetical protein